MPRVKRGVTAKARHKKILTQSKGYRGRRGNVYRIAKEAVMKAGQYQYRDRRTKKREFRALWIARINAAVRELGMSYSTFMAGLKRANFFCRCRKSNRSSLRHSPNSPAVKTRSRWKTARRNISARPGS
ncbi:MAG: 50S ribosomal protein L20 [Betaproteobacteria bacterium]|nr:MAG: 50S ribosomal protein L20 [Betaproteobacteria bacterium]